MHARPGPHETDLFRWQRALGLFGLGSLAALAFGLADQAAARAADARVSAPVALWAADRDAHAVVGLDANLLRVVDVELGWPVDVEARRDGGVWVAHSLTGSPIGQHRLVRLTADGELAAGVDVGAVLDLATQAGRDALVIELGGGAGGADRLLRVDAAAGVSVSLERRGMTAAAGGRGHALIGTDAGAVALYELSRDGAGARWVGEVDLGGEVGDLAPGPEPGGWWALRVTGTGRVYRLDASLAVVWSAEVGIQPLHLAPVRGDERVWLASSTEPALRRFGAAGALELDRRALRLAGLDRAQAWFAGGVVLAAPGAVLHLDARGRSAPGQGGFDFLVDLSRVPSR